MGAASFPSWAPVDAASRGEVEGVAPGPGGIATPRMGEAFLPSRGGGGATPRSRDAATRGSGRRAGDAAAVVTDGCRGTAAGGRDSGLGTTSAAGKGADAEAFTAAAGAKEKGTDESEGVSAAGAAVATLRAMAGGGDAERGSQCASARKSARPANAAADRALRIAAPLRRCRQERIEQGLHRRIARFGPRAEADQQRAPQHPTHARPGRGGPHHAGEGGAAELEKAAPREGPLAVQPLVQRDAEAEHVGARVRGRPRELLRRHVRGRSHERPRSRKGGDCVPLARRRRARRLGVVARGAGEAEVSDPHPAIVAHEHIVRFEVSMDQPGRVRSLEALPGAKEHGEHLAPGARLPSAEGFRRLRAPSR
jgi:hypothetical protein